MLNVKTLTVSVLDSNCHLIYNDEEALIVDPGAEAERIKAAIEELDVRPVAILLTHTHFDHIGAVDEIREEYKIPVYVSSEEEDWLQNPTMNLSRMQGEDLIVRAAEHIFQPEEVVEIGGFSFKVVATPGHSPGSVSFIFADGEFVVTGDALFAGGVGRTVFPGSEPEKLVPNVREKLFTLPDHYTIYPGHRETSTIGKEIKTNPFFN
jgi:glyoxylase-like metal-dependent hydrolase (beta-lactamase superfamily II)